MKNKIAKLSSLVVLVSLLSSCETLTNKKDPVSRMAVEAITESQIHNTELDKRNQISAEQALSTLVIEEPMETKVIEDRFDVSVKDVEVKGFLLGLVDSTDFNLVASPDLDFKISLQLKNVTVSDVLHALTQIYPITVKQKDNLFLVASAESLTAVYTLDYLNIQRKGDSNTSVSGQSAPTGQNNNNRSSDNGQSSSNSKSNNNVQQSKSSNVKTTSETDFWSELSTSLNLIIKNEATANVVVSPHAGIVVVRALPSTQNLIKRYLKSTQKSLDRQVIIEAKIVEVSLDEGYQAGIDWSKMGTTSGDVFSIGQSGQVIRQEVSDTPLNGIFSLLYQGENFTAAIDLLKSQGDVQVLSSPRVSTVNNQKAIIKVGSDEFFVTDISTTTVTGTSTATSPDVTLTPFFSGISLDVTPQVSEDGDIVLHIHPIVSEVTDQPKTLSLGEDSFILPLALTNVRESDSIVRTRSGRVIVIGGLMQNKIGEKDNSTPLLGDIPIIGNLFKQTRQFQIKSELVILLKAHIADDNQSDLELEDVKSRFSQF